MTCIYLLFLLIKAAILMTENTRKGFGLIKVNPLFNLLCIGSCSSAESRARRMWWGKKQRKCASTGSQEADFYQYIISHCKRLPHCSQVLCPCWLQSKYPDILTEEPLLKIHFPSGAPMGVLQKTTGEKQTCCKMNLLLTRELLLLPVPSE